VSTRMDSAPGHANKRMSSSIRKQKVRNGGAVHSHTGTNAQVSLSGEELADLLDTDVTAVGSATEMRKRHEDIPKWFLEPHRGVQSALSCVVLLRLAF
jgi:hypothetical protein